MALLDDLRDFLKDNEQAKNSTENLLPTPKNENGSTLSKDKLFAYWYTDLREHSNSHIHSSSRFEQNNRCVFSIKKFDTQ